MTRRAAGMPTPPHLSTHCVTSKDGRDAAPAAKNPMGSPTVARGLHIHCTGRTGATVALVGAGMEAGQSRALTSLPATVRRRPGVVRRARGLAAPASVRGRVFPLLVRITAVGAAPRALHARKQRTHEPIGRSDIAPSVKLSATQMKKNVAFTALPYRGIQRNQFGTKDACIAIIHSCAEYGYLCLDLMSERVKKNMEFPIRYLPGKPGLSSWSGPGWSCTDTSPRIIGARFSAWKKRGAISILLQNRFLEKNFVYNFSNLRC